MSFSVAKSLNQAVSLLATLPNPRLVAGGTDVVNRIRRLDGGPTAASQNTDWVDISSVSGDAATVTMSEGVVHLGALATYNTILASPYVREHLPSLVEASVGVGSLQIQARGTIGGNLANASPAGDTWPVLISLDAKVVLVSQKEGALCRREMPIQDLFVGPGRINANKGEIIASIDVPVRTDLWAGFHRIGGHNHHIISKVCAALRARLEDGRMRDVRVAFGSVGPTTMRPRRVETLMEGAPPVITAEIQHALIDALSPISDVRSTAEYRHDAAVQLLRLLVDRFVQNVGSVK